MLSPRAPDRGTVLLLFPAAALVMVVLGALVVDVTLSHVRAKELEAVASSAANDALAALDVGHLRSTGELRIDDRRAAVIVHQSVAAGPLPSATVDAVTVTSVGGRPVIAVTLTLVVDLVMAPALPGDLDSTTITRTRTATVLG